MEHQQPQSGQNHGRAMGCRLLGHQPFLQMIPPKHTIPNHAMPCQPCIALAGRGERPCAHVRVCGNECCIPTISDMH